MSQNPRRPRRLIPKLLLIVFGVLFGIIIAEGTLRIAGYSYPLFYQPDYSRGYALRPRAEGWYRLEGQSYVRINSDGLRDREHSLTKPHNTVRIAVLGDSYPEALQVSLEQSFWAVLEKKLNECDASGGRDVEIINFGVSGYGTAQQLITLKEQVWKYSPDIVMLTVTTANDITDNSRVLKKTNEIPYFVYQNNQLTLDDAFKRTRSFRWSQSSISSLARALRVHSRVIQAGIQAHRGLKVATESWRVSGGEALPPGSNKNPESAAKADLFSRSDELGPDNLVYLEPSNAVWNDAWRVTEGLMVAMRDEVRARGAKFVVVTLSNGPQVLPTREAREHFAKRFGIIDQASAAAAPGTSAGLFYPDNRIKSLGLREQIPVITLAPELLEFAERNRTWIHGFGANIGNGHWNETGHRVAGEVLAQKMCGGGPFQIASVP